MIVDSGERRHFETGAVRDIQEGKGRCDLLPLDVLGEFAHSLTLARINEYIRTGEVDVLFNILAEFARVHYHDCSTAMLELSKHYEEGCLKYGDRNWEKGIPLHCFIDSAVRHFLKIMRCDSDEDHERAFMWNLVGAIWTQRHRPEMIDLPFAQKKEPEVQE